MDRRLKAAPLREYADETWADWIRRQGNPVKATAKTNKKDPINAARTAPGSSIATPRRSTT